MSMIWFEGFEAMDTATIGDYYTTSGGAITVDSSPPSGRSNKAMEITNAQYFQVDFTDEQDLVIGTAVQKSAVADAATVIQLLDGAGSIQAQVLWTAASTFQLRRGAFTVLDTSTSSSFADGTWHYIELKITIANAGTWEFKVDGIVEMSGSGDTQNAASNQTRLFRCFSAGFDNFHYDDMYILDQNGSAPYNDYLGDVTVESIVADGAGTTTDWTPSAGSNFENVDDVPHDGDTTYNSSSAINDIDLYTMGSIAVSTVTVYGVQTKVVARKEASGDRTTRPVIRTGGVNFEGDTVALTTSYGGTRHVWEENPDTVAAWTGTEVNAIEAGIKVQS